MYVDADLSIIRPRSVDSGQGRFNPIGYHVGTIWPFDKSFIAWGSAPLDGHLIVAPAIPASVGQLELFDVPGRRGRIDAFGRERVTSSPTGSASTRAR